jgi:hypothetical protein
VTGGALRRGDLDRPDRGSGALHVSALAGRPAEAGFALHHSGVVQVTAITSVDDATLTGADAYAAGFESLTALLRWLSRRGEGELYRLDIRLAGPDPRVALRATGQLSPAELADLTVRLRRMDEAADRPWTEKVLEQIGRRPGVVSTELAVEAGQDRASYKFRVRRLKALGLTESLEVGYRLSPRGRAYLAARMRHPAEPP